MKNIDTWSPTKYLLRNGQLIASRDSHQIGIGSRLIGDIVAGYYQKFIPEFVRGRLLDLGCGTVPLYAAYRDFCTEVTCVDWNNTLHKNNHVDVYCDLTAPLPFDMERFETVLLSDVLEHIPTPEALFQELFRILSRKGIALINVPFYYWLHETPFDYYRYTEFALTRFAKQSGFDVVLLKPIGGVPEILADISAKYWMTHYCGKYISITVQKSTSLFLKTKIGKRISEKTGKIFPLGYFLVLQKPS